MVKATKTQSKILDKKAYGDEPFVAGKELTQVEIIQAYNWYNAMRDTDDAKSYLLSYLKSINAHNTKIKKVQSIPNSYFPHSLGWKARLIQNGAIIEDAQASILKRVDELNSTAPNEERQYKPNVQDRMKEKLAEWIGEIECLFDKAFFIGERISFYDEFSNMKIPPLYMSGIINYYQKYLSVEEDKKAIKIYSEIVSACEQYGQVKRKTRAARKKKPVSKEKKLKSFKFMVEGDGMASISPEKLIGSQEAWLWNTKTKILTVLRALDKGGLDVKGTTILNYDEKTSKSKRARGVRTEPKIMLDTVINGGKVALRKFMDDFGKRDAELQTRMNEHTLILRII